jgi:hypothetical protein
MTTLKRRKQAIDKLIGFGQMTSVQVYQAVATFPQFNDNTKADLVSYIMKNHMDEELEMHLYVTMGYDPMLHRMQVGHDGTLSF